MIPRIIELYPLHTESPFLYPYRHGFHFKLLWILVFKSLSLDLLLYPFPF